MKAGDKVKSKRSPKVGTSLGHVTRFGVEWILVMWDTGSQAIVLESALEVINSV